MPTSLSVSSKMLWFGLKRNIKYLSKLLIWSQTQMCLLIDPKPEESYNMLKVQNISNEALILRDKTGCKKIILKSLWISCATYIPKHTTGILWSRRCKLVRIPKPLAFLVMSNANRQAIFLNWKTLASKLLFITMPLTFCSGNFWLKGQLSVKFSVDAC